MTMTPRSLGPTTADAPYDFLRIEGIEGFRSYVYDDGQGVPTLGVGYALAIFDETDEHPEGEWMRRSTLDADLAAIGVVMSDNDKFRLDNAILLLNGDPTGENAFHTAPTNNPADNRRDNNLTVRHICE